MRRCFFAVVLALLAPNFLHADTINWPQLRGTHADGMAEGMTLPDHWSVKENVVWKKDLPGWGWSSPIVWGDRIFLTTAISEKEMLEKPIIGGYPGGNIHPKDTHRWVTYCLDRETGKIIWEREAFKGIPPQPRHPRNSYASETPVTDGERVYSYFGNIGLYCYDMDGKKLWEEKWGDFGIRGGWGPGISPVLHKDRIFIMNDNQKSSFLEALDKRTGKQIWKVERDEKSNWATPYIWENKMRTELITVGTNKVRSYDLDGKVLWELGPTSGLVSLQPLAKGGLLYVGSGYHIGPLYAVKPGAAGNISLKPGETSNAWIAWSRPDGAGIHPGFLISGDRLYSLFDAGFLTCFDAKTGKELYKRKKVSEGKGRFYASPWAYNGKVFMLNEDGTTYVIEDGPEYKLLGKCALEDNAWATPAISHGSLFVRTYASLFRLQAKKQN